MKKLLMTCFVLPEEFVNAVSEYSDHAKDQDFLKVSKAVIDEILAGAADKHPKIHEKLVKFIEEQIKQIRKNEI